MTAPALRIRLLDCMQPEQEESRLPQAGPQP
jgi:hypothetical protein